MRAGLIFAGLWLSICFAHGADRATELAKLHIEVVGGAERIAALAALRATGTVLMDSGQVRFTMIAARPNQVRLESSANGRRTVQGYDGVEPPWEFDSGRSGRRYRDMAEANAKRLIADSEYDDPLIAGTARGYTFDYAGEVEKDGRKLLRLLVTYRLTETFALLIDPETYLIEYRVETHSGGVGRPTEIITQYDKYLPVDGVLVPHAITTVTDGRVTQMMRIEQIVPNPPIGPETFSRPKTVTLPGR
jgi:hypothetical protein